MQAKSQQGNMRLEQYNQPNEHNRYIQNISPNRSRIHLLL
jgi:hypothetical protein